MMGAVTPTGCLKSQVKITSMTSVASLSDHVAHHHPVEGRVDGWAAAER